MKLLAVAALIVLTGCATQQTRLPDPKPGDWSSYRDMAYNRARLRGWIKDVPGTLQDRFYGCEIDTVVANMTPDELDRWNAYARGETGATDAELQAFDDQMDHRIGGNDGMKAAMQRRCPDVVADIAKYGI